jgi:hypothetical protein
MIPAISLSFSCLTFNILHSTFDIHGVRHCKSWHSDVRHLVAFITFNIGAFDIPAFDIPAFDIPAFDILPWYQFHNFDLQRQHFKILQLHTLHCKSYPMTFSAVITMLEPRLSYDLLNLGTATTPAL